MVYNIITLIMVLNKNFRTIINKVIKILRKVNENERQEKSKEAEQEKQVWY